MRLDINLATQPYEDQRRFWMRWGTGTALAAIVTLALLATTISGWLSARRDRQTVAQMRAKIAERDQERAQAEALLNQPQNRAIRDRSTSLNDLFQRKSFSWTMVFEDLERIMPGQLHVVSIHPETTPDSQLQIKLVVAGQSRDRALELVKKLEESPHFHHTQITEEAVANGQNPADAITYDISAEYVPGVAPAEVAAKAPSRGAP
jgi:type IV pilus assembly protein PilN